MFRAIADGRPGALRPRPVRRLPRHRRRRRRARRPRPTPRSGSTSTTGAGRACRSSSAPASTCRPPRPRSGSCSSSRRGSGSASSASRPRARPDRGQARPVDRRADRCSTPSAADAASRSRSPSTWSSPSRAARARRPTRCCCTRPWSADARASPARTASRSSGGSCSRCSTRRRRSTATRQGSWGPAAADELVAGHGGWHGPWVRVMSDATAPTPAVRPQSAAAPSPFPPIEDYAFLSDCHTGALVAPGRIGRLAVRPALRLAEHLRHAARPPGRHVPVRPVRHQRTRPRGRTCPGPTCSSTTLEHADRAGWWCATR